MPQLWRARASLRCSADVGPQLTRSPWAVSTISERFLSFVDRAAAAHISGVTALRGSLPSRVSVSTFLGSVLPAQRMVSRHLDEHEPDTVSVGDPHLDQAPRLALRRAQDVHVERLKPLMLGADIAHLQPQRDRSGAVQRPAAGHFKGATAEEEDDIPDVASPNSRYTASPSTSR